MEYTLTRGGYQVPCSFCTKIVLRDLNKIKRNKRFFCSPECQERFGRLTLALRHEPVKCLQCGKPPKTKYSLYCSSVCRKAALQIRTEVRRNDPIYRQQWRDRTEKRSKNPNWLKNLKAGVAARNTPEYQAKLRQGIARRMADPTWHTSMKNNPCWQKGKKHPSWSGNRPPHLYLRGTPEYKTWRTSVFERDNYICQKCKVKGGMLHAHHIKEWATHPHLRFDISNGLTVCQQCHMKIHHGKHIPNHSLTSGQLKPKQLRLF